MSITPESVQELLTSEEASDRMNAVNQLRQLDPTIAFELIQPPITDVNARVRYAAVSQMATLGRQDRARSLEVLRDRLLNDSEVDVKAAAADALAALKLTEAFEDLQQLYHQTSEWLLHVSIVAALGEMGDRRSFDLLEHALASENPLIRTVAIGSLGELGDPRAVPLLLPFAADSDWQIRYRAAQALGNLGGEDAAPALAELSHDSVDMVAQMAQSFLNAAP